MRIDPCALRAVGCLLLVASATCHAQGLTDGPGWHSRSLTSETVVGPQGSITTRTALGANARLGVTVSKVAEAVAPGVYALRGWGIAHSFAIEAPNGWIIVDTGDSTRAAAEMRETLERTVGRKIKVAAILLTHWHYADGTAAWLDEGAELWGHEHLDRNRSASAGIAVLGGVTQSRAIAQFGVFHPMSGPDAFPNLMSFTPEKFLAVSSYRPPARLFADGKVMDLVIAGEPVQVAPVRTDTTDSVGFYFPQRRLMVTNFLVMDTIFNIYTLRGGTYRDPQVLVSDARWVESKNAEILLDIHGPTLKGQATVRDALERSVDSVQLIHDQTLRQIASGKGPREAAETVYVPPQLRDGREAYGQVESHVRQVYSGNLGWFDGDVYEINPLALKDEARRTIRAMGGPEAVRKSAAQAVAAGGFDNWRWGLKLTSLLLTLDPADASARKTRAAAARALGQRTDSANARGFYITEALQMEGKLMVQGQPVTLDAIRRLLGTPRPEQLAAASVDQILQFMRYLVDPRKAQGKRLAFTMAAEGDPQVRRVELRNGVLVITVAAAAGPTHIEVTRQALADFVLGGGQLTSRVPVLEALDAALDRSRLLARTVAVPAALDAKGNAQRNYGLEH
jgi:alkyl sulfatase BDS1-like metallo-beta-lactamase superfamily hydrolase